MPFEIDDGPAMLRALTAKSNRTRPAVPAAAALVRAIAGLGAALSLAALAVIVTPPAPGLAQSAEDQQGSSYLTPFPDGERYKLRVVGDEYGEGIHGALLEALSSEPRLDIEKKHIAISGLTRPDSEAEIKSVVQVAVREKPHIAVVMLGSTDRWSYRTPDGKRHAVGTPEWRKVYAQRADDLIRGLKAAGVGVYWIGLPIMRKWETNEAAQAQNQVFRERAYLNGIRFIDAFASFADEQGEYNAYGPDTAGKIRLLRDADGMHMTDAGYQKLAHFLERELKRDLSQAKNERAIPLAGSEAEQALVNPARHAAKPQSGSGSGSWSSVASRQPDDAGASGGQSADTSRINLKTVGSDGREQVIPIEIVRPAIPAAVIALVTRRESADKAAAMGDQVVDQIPGGLTVMSSITPGADAASGALSRRKLSPAQTPYFRVLVKGERISSRPGRADDTSWPRPEPEPEQRPAKKSDAGAAATAEGSLVPGSAVPLPTAKPRR